MVVNLAFLLLLLLFVSSANAKATVSISPKTLNRSGDSVVIKWSGVESPSDLDWLGIYSPPTSPHDHFIGYKLLNASSTWRSGSGSISLPLTNLRSNYSFRIFRWTQSEIDPKHLDHDQNPLPGTKHLLAESEEVSFGSGVGKPEQIHLAFEDGVNGMRVTFVAGDGEERFVRYGERKERLGNSAPARGVSFIARDVYSEETIAFMFGDMGCATPYTTFIRTQDESISTLKWILRDIEALGDKPALVSHIGDISYARGYSWVWDEFFAQIEPIASRVPYHVCIGNHDVPYSMRFNMPGNSSEPTGTKAPPTRNLYYSYDVGSVHFVYISTETNFLRGGRQYEFVKRDLESVNREKTPFVVVQGHRPMYTTSNEVRDAMIRQKMVEHLEPLLVENDVTLALWGHVHRYERFCPMRNNTCGKLWRGSPVHLVIGMAGQDWQPIWEPRPNHPGLPIFPQPEQSMYRTGEFGYTRLVANKEKLTVSFVGNHDGEVHDTVEMLASGEVISGSKDDTVKTVPASATLVGKAESNVSWYVKGAGLMVMGVLLGFIVGFFTKGKKGSTPDNRWIPVKNEET
ncbi:hypothetical protein HID58_030908 [Brassica napus]|uniref:Purple acid phosphatase n=2 Tax=Brassica napus TaxID=3708 RepID=A0ABQ8CI79_BRANA|nr:hypothetical protein HID58_030908 [Brassica napus]